MEMPLHVDLADMIVRLLLAALAGALLGFNRGQGGHAAGFRTTILVSLAAAVAMIQANLLLPVGGKSPDSFSVMDVARFPLGILTGVGFIGGGTILKRGNLVTGVTTAATLWIATAIGLCFGGGQIVLGIVGTVLAAITLWWLSAIDDLIPRWRKALVTVAAPGRLGRSAELLNLPTGCHAEFRSVEVVGDQTLTRFELVWQAKEQSAKTEALLEALRGNDAVVSVQLQLESNH